MADDTVTTSFRADQSTIEKLDAHVEESPFGSRQEVIQEALTQYLEYQVAGGKRLLWSLRDGFLQIGLWIAAVVLGSFVLHVFIAQLPVWWLNALSTMGIISFGGWWVTHRHIKQNNIRRPRTPDQIHRDMLWQKMYDDVVARINRDVDDRLNGGDR